MTELVINALKHGFPRGEKGEILVKYEAQNSGWQLSVAAPMPLTDSIAKDVGTRTNRPPLSRPIVDDPDAVGLAHVRQGLLASCSTMAQIAAIWAHPCRDNLARYSPTNPSSLGG